ncbi:MAG TPA: cobalt-precorrin-6A reductase [Kineosporiaceae bacterium]
MRVLVLGGTGEARSLAERLAGHPDLDVVSSLAGRLREPRLPPGRLRIGGFGDVEGLRRTLLDDGIDRVIDATHPFAARITAHAVAATRAAGVPLAVLRRPSWRQVAGDRWQRVASTAEAAAAAAAGPDGTVLLTLGRRDVVAFAGDDRHRYVVRSIEPVQGPLPPRHEVVLGRGPFPVDRERALLRRYAVALLVTRDSGGELTAAKLVAARELGVPVVLVERPPLPTGVTVAETVDDAEAWLTSDRGTARAAWPS